MDTKNTPSTHNNIVNYTFRYDFDRDGGGAGLVLTSDVLIGSPVGTQIAWLAIISTPNGVATSGAVTLDIGTTEDPNAFFAAQAIVALNPENPVAGVDLQATPYALRPQVANGEPNAITMTILVADITSGIIDFNLLAYDLG